MNIGIDARLLERKITGIGRFLINFLKELPDVDSQNKYFLYTYEPIDFNKNFFTNISTVKSYLPQKIFSPLWSNFILPKYLKKNKIDLFFSVNQLIPLVKIENLKYISVVHDVIYKADKSFLPFIYRKYLQLFAHFSVKSSDLIITVSNYSKQDILKHYKIDEKKIKVIHAAAQKEFKPNHLTDDDKNEIKHKLNLSDRTVLYVGMIENRKNITGIINIADEVYKKDKTITFLLIGKIGHGGEKLHKEILKRKNIVHVNGVEDHLLKKLFNFAFVFLFPSYYEGFGFPPLEAMQSGLPVTASNKTSLKEIIADGGLLHDPSDFKAFASDILSLIADKEFHKKMREKGIERAAHFSLNKMVKEIVDVFNSINI